MVARRSTCNSARGSRPNLADPSCLRTKGTKKCRKAYCRKQQPNSGRDQRVRKKIDDLGGPRCEVIRERKAAQEIDAQLAALEAGHIVVTSM